MCADVTVVLEVRQSIVGMKLSVMVLKTEPSTLLFFILVGNSINITSTVYSLLTGSKTGELSLISVTVTEIDL